MRILLLAFPTRTHIYSLAPLGWALRAAGHEVRYAGPRNPAEDESFLETGLDAMWLGRDLDIARHRRLTGADNMMESRFLISESRPDRYTDEYVRTVYGDWAEALRWTNSDPLLDELLRFARQWRPDLVVWDPLMYAGPMVAKLVGAAHVRMMYAADQSARIIYQYREMADRLGPEKCPDPLATWITAWLARHGADFDESMLVGQATIDPSPACIRYSHLPVRYLPVRFAPVNRAMAMPDWVVRPPQRPRVCLTLGVSNRQMRGEEDTSVAALLDGLAAVDAEIVATLSAAQLASVPRLPGNVRTVDFVPLNELLATCAAVVHQGGGATIGNAVHNGVPQLIVPGPTWSERVSALALRERGDGLLLDLDEVSPQTIRAGVERLLNEPSFRAAALAGRDEMLRTPSLNDLVGDLEVMAMAA